MEIVVSKIIPGSKNYQIGEFLRHKKLYFIKSKACWPHSSSLISSPSPLALPILRNLSFDLDYLFYPLFLFTDIFLEKYLYLLSLFSQILLASQISIIWLHLHPNIEIVPDFKAPFDTVDHSFLITLFLWL